MFDQILFLAVPDMAKVKSWPSMEINGWIYLWYHAEGIDPTWLPPELEEITKGNWQYSGRSEHHINSHIEVQCPCYLIMPSVPLKGHKQIVHPRSGAS